MSLDVGEKRIGVAMADNVKISTPHSTIDATSSDCTDQIVQLIKDNGVTTLVVGYPRNQSGDPTAQSKYVEGFVAKLDLKSTKIVYQDESLTSVMAEDILKKTGKPYDKADIDSMAASLILTDYIERELF